MVNNPEMLKEADREPIRGLRLGKTCTVCCLAYYTDRFSLLLGSASVFPRRLAPTASQAALLILESRVEG